MALKEKGISAEYLSSTQSTQAKNKVNHPQLLSPNHTCIMMSALTTLIVHQNYYYYSFKKQIYIVIIIFFVNILRSFDI